MDTYTFPDKEYMARWAKEVLTAYPNFNIVGEAWLNYPELLKLFGNTI